jgi:hypothetical protein
MIYQWFDIKITVTVSHRFEPQNRWRRFMSGLASKPVATVSSGFVSKPAATVFFSLALKLAATISPGLTSKPVFDFLVDHQNQGGGGFFSLDLKTDNFGLVIWVSKSS